MGVTKLRKWVAEWIPMDTSTWNVLVSHMGLDIENIQDVKPLDDGTLGYEGFRVLVYIRDQILRKGTDTPGYKYHVAECRTLIKMREKKRFERYVATSRTDGLFIVNIRYWDETPDKHEVESRMDVCRNCLQALDWENYSSASKPRRDEIFKRFSPERFFEKYGQTRVESLPVHTPQTAPSDEYSAHWHTISTDYREYRKWLCEECGRDLTEHKSFLHVHHIDGVKSNDVFSNLQALCIRCHARMPLHSHMLKSPDYARYVDIFGYW